MAQFLGWRLGATQGPEEKARDALEGAGAKVGAPNNGERDLKAVVEGIPLPSNLLKTLRLVACSK